MKARVKYFIFAFLFLKNIVAFTQVIAVVGDFENTPVQVDSVSLLVKSWNPELIVTSGDNFDPFSGLIDDQVGPYYAEYIYPYVGTYGPGALSNKFFPALGNHEVYSDGLTQYLTYYSLPGLERYYAVPTGNIIFYILNSNTSEPDGYADTSAQALWLQNELAQAGNNWKIVVCHHPPYTSGPHVSSVYMQWPFSSWGVDAVISGHNHFYERLYKEGVSYFVNGAGGATLYSFGTLIPESQFQYNKCWGAMKLQPYLDSLVLGFYTIHDSLVDQCVIIKNPVGTINEPPEVHVNITQDMLSLTFSSIVHDPINIEVYNIEGQLLSSHYKLPEVNNGCTINISGLKTGMYILKIFNSKIFASEKIIVIQ